MNAWEYSKGTVVYDPTFDPFTEPNQQWLYDFCVKLNSSDLVKLDTDTGKKKLSCYMMAFKEWVERNGFKFPVVESQVK